ncbi:MAG: hypothetical protein HC824_14990 [Synechococcales cyanobacterium RM1_1_8]|nr:hypothetical protein [Synechococcales cyanobacterium RM1_1_8]
MSAVLVIAMVFWLGEADWNLRAAGVGLPLRRTVHIGRHPLLLGGFLRPRATLSQLWLANLLPRGPESKWNPEPVPALVRALSLAVLLVLPGWRLFGWVFHAAGLPEIALWLDLYRLSPFSCGLWFLVLMLTAILVTQFESGLRLLLRHRSHAVPATTSKVALVAQG